MDGKPPVDYAFWARRASLPPVASIIATHGVATMILPPAADVFVQNALIEQAKATIKRRADRYAPKKS